MHLVALTGGIASGKSTVARRLAEHGAVVVDADVLAREVVEPGEPALAAIAERFGPSVIRADGALDRPALGAIVFSDAAARADLNAITHPAVTLRSQRLFAEAAEADPDAVVVYDVPLLAEGRGAGEFDEVVVVHAPQHLRIERLVARRGLTEEEARARVSSQASDEERLALADVVIDSSGTLEETLARTDALWERLAR
ncbi:MULTISPECIES: dephospho-CoA kinase [unclassified Rathayibacter]|uniref:dephospho-CoA kinase n=1 Tax=unclassified Rathayibacter TaxID=2609250 RepID=UPI000CE84970|nr:MULTISPECIES: dephospho-CoA kinase [unclassified Rathayibacter]PPF19415.1 dephospho-CoA kinase [Rathayibacter sp. AY1A4]PPG82750.1 dephospho-CoA kinase [Rathayibacter sp. AY1E5]PPH32122.1 dephospho-CoA kinase [Rathayibacter sp. AY1C3]PPH65541.1 dephospho-CoA kinase [Rathayibacter sp. AY1D7]PPI33611.1 dephospho-CoA kinase [Rathayibacter sp. AY1B4]